MSKVTTKWRWATYDVWGNANDGYDVNDVYSHSVIELDIPITVNNVATPQQFKSAYPTDKQIRELFGIGRTRIDTGGDDLCIYVNRVRDGYPIGEMECVSHRSLSPIELRISCDQCSACMINGVFCHETGCPNTHSRYSDGLWIKTRKCFECGCTVDADDTCCNGTED